MGILDLFRKKKTGEVKEVSLPKKEIKVASISEDDLGNELVMMGDYIDVSNPDNIVKFKHNLKILIEKTKKAGRIENFFLIREDDILPLNHEWIVSSKDTTLELTSTSLSYQLRKEKAIKDNNLRKQINGLDLPIDDDKLHEAMINMDKRFATFLLPSHFRSTKHFTINTPLGYTGDYNAVSTNRNFIVIDPIDNFINSGYGYSVAYHDAYLDVSHESLKISSKAVILIDNDKYDEIMNNSDYKEELSKYHIIRFSGDEDLAINMVLSELGGLPSQIGYLYANYDNELKNIIDSTIKRFARDNGLYFDRSHAGDIFVGKGHFSNYYDNMNQDFNETLSVISEYLTNRLGIKVTNMDLTNSSKSYELIKKVGLDELIKAVDDYNMMIRDRFKASLAYYHMDRENIDNDIHKLFISTIGLISEYYDDMDAFEDVKSEEFENMVKSFFQGDTVEKQIDAANMIKERLKRKEFIDENEISNGIKL